MVYHLLQRFQAKESKKKMTLKLSKSQASCNQKTKTWSRLHQKRHANTLGYSRKDEEQLTRRTWSEIRIGNRLKLSLKIRTLS